MEEAEKMAALKRAYADIILNTAKEAAARILVSERKSLRFQKDLFAAKEEALNTLLRLKQLMELKVAKAEQVSLFHKKKVQELEAQLNEAEDIVKDLRDELKRVYGELEKVKHNLVGPLTEKVVKVKNKVSSLSSDNKGTQLKQRSAEGNCCFVTEKPITQSEPEANNSDLATIMLRSKEQELFRNGCTQRIRAFEQNLLTGNVSPLHENNGSIVNEFVVADQTCLVGPTPTKADVVNQAEVLNDLKEVKGDKGRGGNFFQRFSSRRPRGRCKYLKTTETEEKPSEDNTEKVQKDMGSHLLEETEKTLEDLNDQSGMYLASENPTERHCEKTIEELKVEDISVCKVNHERSDGPLENENSKGETREANGIPDGAVSNGHLKYTFRRKRKREPLSNQKEEAAVENKSTLESGGGKKQSPLPPQQNSGHVMESSRDSRRLVQVARQLISLSEKQWW